MIRIVTAALAALLVTAPVYAAEAPSAPVTLKSDAPDAKQGAVTFKHATHKAEKCTACHATDAGGKNEALHGAKSADTMKAAHGVCLDCHKKDASKKAPTKCTDCHVKK